ncbi:MAG TPA: GNAT family N-acetyltransferase [Solirubrobacteraceae bacterium]|nr:GNAT family N-acetyltransferase [Solirubrobacteraceae bacterium]
MSEAATAGEPALRPSRWPERVTLRDGSEVEIRPVRADDKQLLRDGFERLSAESRYRRFLVPMPKLSARLVRYLTEVDHHDHEALGALAADGGEPVGIARYVRTDAGSDAAEVAVAVVDDWHGRGVATALLTRLAERAREEGIVRFTATCQAGNEEALDLVGDLGATRMTGTDPLLVEAQIELPAASERSLSELLRAAAARRLVFRPRWPAEPR